MTASPAQPSPVGGTRRKSLLFCPECGHESPIDGDWEVRHTGSGPAVHCPDCERTLTIRDRAPLASHAPWIAPIGNPAGPSLVDGRVFARSVGVALGLASWPWTVA